MPKIRILQTVKTSTEPDRLTEEELEEQLDPLIRNLYIVNSFVRILQQTGYEHLYFETKSIIQGSIEILIRKLLLSSNVYPIIFTKSIESAITIRTPRDLTALTINGRFVRKGYDTSIKLIGLAISNHIPKETLEHIEGGSLTYDKIIPYKPNFIPSRDLIKPSKNKVADALKQKGITCYYFIDFKNTKEISNFIDIIYTQIRDAYHYILFDSKIYTLQADSNIKFPKFDVKLTSNIIEKDKLSKEDKIIKDKLSQVITPNSIDIGLFNDLTKLKLQYITSNKEFDIEIKRLLIKKEVYDEINAKNVENIKKELLCKTYQNIIQSKFGSKKIEFIKKILELGQPELILKSLTPTEQHIVEVNIAAQQKLQTNYTHNKCKHIPIYKKLIGARFTDEQKEALKELEKFFISDTSKKSNDILKQIICKECNLIIMCSHQLERYKLDISNAPYGEIRNVLSKWASPRIVKDNFWITYCKVCSGYLTKQTSIEVNIGNVTDDSLVEYFTLIRAEAYGICNTLIFETTLTVGEIVNLTSKFIVPFLQTIDEDILKLPKKKVPDQLKMNIYISILVHSFLLYILLASEYVDQVSIKGKKIKGARRNKEYTSFIFHKLMNSIKNKEVILTPEYVMSKFNLYYNTIRKYVLSRQIIFQKSDPKLDIINHIVNIDPVYSYARAMYFLHNPHIKIGKTLTNKDIRDEFEIIMGTNLNTIITNLKENKNIYTKIYKPNETKQSSLEKLAFLNQSIQKNANELVKTWLGGNEEDIDSYLGIHILESSITGGKVAKNKSIKIKQVNNTTEQQVISNAKDIYVGYLKESYDFYYEYITKGITEDFSYRFNKLKEGESTLRLNQLVTTFIVDLGVRNKKLVTRIPITKNEVYDDKGRKHNFSIYVYSEGEFTKKQISKDVTIKGNSSSLIDVRCSICGVLKSEINTIDSEKVNNILESKAIVNTMITFYNNQCPVSGIHDFSDKSLCKKCGYLDISSDDSDKFDSFSYYNKYKDQYNKDQQNEISTRIIITSKAQEIPSKIDYSYNHNSVIELADKFSISPHLFENIGGFDQQFYSDIIDHKIILEPVTDPHDYRIYALENTIRTVFTNYNILKNYAKLLVVPIYIQNIVSDYPLDKLSSLKGLSNISSQFTKDYQSIKAHETLEKQHLYLIETLCKLLLDLSKKENPVNKFAEAEVERIIETEKAACKRNTAEIELADDYQDIVIIDKKFDPFSYENMDYDGENDDSISIDN